MSQVEKTMFDPEVVRQDFPILNQTIHRNQPLVYLDNGASTQRPRSVIQAMVDCYEKSYANVHRGVHYLSERSSAQYEDARKAAAKFIGADHAYEAIFTSGTTHALNLVAYSWGEANVGKGDEILISIMEHHSNIVPWQMLAERKGAAVRWVDITDDGQLDWEDFSNKLSEKTRIVACGAVSNVLGTMNDIQEIVRQAHECGAIVVVDAAQHVPHAQTDVAEWDVDFLTFSGHKMLGPSGIGILYGKRQILESMPAFMGGGSMISSVTKEGYTLGELPAKFEAGTPPIAQAIGLHAAIEYLQSFDMNQVLHHEQALADVVIQRASEIEGFRLLGPTQSRAGIVSFVIDGLSTQDIALLLDRKGIAVRSGHHCAMPLHDRLYHRNSCRASFYLYNTVAEAEYFCDSLAAVVGKLR